MFPPEFDYRRARSIEEAIDLLAGQEDAVPLAGGHSLIPEMKSREATPATVIDLGGIASMEGIDVEDGEIRVGALTTYAALLDSDALWDDAEVLAEAASKLGDRQIRNRGTIGGNLAQSDPGADLPAAVVAADATLEIVGERGERDVGAEEFFAANGTDLDDHELVRAVRVPRQSGGGAYVKKTHPATGYALIGVAVTVGVEAGVVTDAWVAANGLLDMPVRLDAVETALVGESREAIEAVSERAASGLAASDLRSDPQVSGEFRANVLPVYVEEALSEAFDRASGA